MARSSWTDEMLMMRHAVLRLTISRAAAWAQKKSAFQVDIKYPVPLLFCDIHEWAVNLHTRVVDHDIQAIELLDRLLDQPYGLLILRNIGLNDESFALVLLDNLSHFLRLILRMGIVHDNGRPFFGELNGNPAANAAIGSRHNGNFLI